MRIKRKKFPSWENFYCAMNVDLKSVLR